jgi:predicted Zn finger-like uncharacterized protein
MDVRCDRCQTEYEFDEARLTEAGVAVKCTACGNVFKVRRPPSAVATIELERPRQWKVRRADGQVYALKDLPELQRWIVERRVSRDDEVSLSGDAWRQLGSMPELASFFEVVEAAEQAQRAAAAPAPAPSAMASTQISPAGATPAFGRPAVGAQSTGSASWEKSPQSFSPAPTAEPAWTASPSFSAVDEDLAAEDMKHVRGSRAPAIIVTLIVLAGLGGAGYFLMKQSQKAPAPAAPVPAAPGAVGETGPAVPPAAIAATGGVAPQPVTAPAAATAPSDGGPTAPTTAVGNTAPIGAPAVAATPKPAPAAVSNAKAETKAEAKPEGDATSKPKAAPEGAEPPKGHDYNWYLSRGRKLLDTHPSQAVGMFEQASQANASSPEPDSGRGIAYSNLEQWPKAISAFQAALKKSPEFNEAVMGLAEAYRYSGNKKEALLYYKRYLELTPDGADAPAAKAQIQSLKDD